MVVLLLLVLEEEEEEEDHLPLHRSCCITSSVIWRRLIPSRLRRLAAVKAVFS